MLIGAQGISEMTDLSLTILPESTDDAVAIERLHERTFGPGRYARSAYRIREGVSHDLALSFTARIGTLLVGSVRLSPVRIGETRGLLLGPLTIEPPFRGQGIAVELMGKDGCNMLEDKCRGETWVKQVRELHPNISFVYLAGVFLYGFHVNGDWHTACSQDWDSKLERVLERRGDEAKAHAVCPNRIVRGESAPRGDAS